MKPPNTPEEGIKDYEPIPFTVDIEETCAVNADEITLTCYSFLGVYIQNVTYGRGSGNEICDGKKPKDNKGPSPGNSCYNETIDTIITEELKQECHGSYTCQYTVPTFLLDVSCDGMKRELRLEYTCGKIFPNLLH